MACKRSSVQVRYPPLGRRPLESRQEKVESRRIRDLEIFQGKELFITAQLSPYLLGLLSAHYSLLFLESLHRVQALEKAR